MATAPSDHRVHQQSELTSTAAQDPFWQSTRQYNSGSLAALMEAMQQIVPPPPTIPVVQKPKIPAQPHHARRGQCTHITMIRLHTSQPCLMCNKPASMGWLYACRQDWLLDHQASVTSKESHEGLSAADDTNYFEVMARMAVSLNMSSSVVNQIRNGAYTSGEVDKLIAQKKHLLNVIRGKGKSAIEGTMSTLDPKLDSALAATTTPAKPTRAPSKDTANANRCNYMICHTCRPFLQDRIFTTVDTIVKGEHPPITEDEMKMLPMHDPATVRTLSARYPPYNIQTGSPLEFGCPGSADVTDQQNDGAEEGGISETSSTRSSLSSLYDYDDEDDPASLYPCPGAGVCPVYSRNSGCAYGSGFDDGQRAYNHGLFTNDPGHSDSPADHMTPDRSRHRQRHVEDNAADTPGGTTSTASSISLPTPATSPLTPETPLGLLSQHALAGKTSKAATVCGIVSPIMDLEFGQPGRQHQSSSGVDHNGFDDELDVDGGVALTEGVVGTGMPDIISHH